MVLGREIRKLLDEQSEVQDFPNDIISWLPIGRPKIDGKPYNLDPYPFWGEIYEDPHDRIMVMAARQVFKSTWLANVLAFNATTKPESVTIYCTHDGISLRGFSTQKYRYQTLAKNPGLRSFCEGKKSGFPGNLNEIGFKNGARSYLVIDEAQYGHVAGKSPNEVLLDEAQAQELEHLPVVMDALSTTFGKIKIVGIGGEEGSPLWELWQQTNQMHWRFKDKYWRDRLRYDGKWVLLGNYLEDVMDGKWVPLKPQNYDFPGYWIPQTIMPHIPLKIADAIRRGIPRMQSIEYKQKHYPKSHFETHVMGRFYKAMRRPITPAMVKACMTPYEYLELIPPERADEVIDIKQTFGKKAVKVLMGVDYGSGIADSSTVIAIMIKWKRRNNAESRYQLAWIDERPPENPDDQAQYINNLFKIYGVDTGVGDLAYGAVQIKRIQDGGHDRRTGKHFTGVGNTGFVGSRTLSREQMKLEFKEKTVDESGEEVQQVIIDNTQVLDDFVSFMDWKVPHPLFPDVEEYRRPKFMIPYADESAVEWLIKDFTSLLRKDLEKITDVIVEDKRQHARKEYNHPKDSLIACILCLVADQQPEPSYEVGGIYGTGRSRPGGTTPRSPITGKKQRRWLR